ncbi:MAG TPA: hypothetical protein VE986_09390 [Hyphomicrobiales bacterium]|nr:hypothetical protein [Hyphomicrobiales bacterium]
MNMKFVSGVAVIAAFACLPAFAQQQGQPPKASKAEVQKVVDSIKADKAKLAQFCAITKIQEQYSAAAEKKDEKKLQDLDKQMEEAAKKLGPDFERVTSSELDDESANLLDTLAKSCT